MPRIIPIDPYKLIEILDRTRFKPVKQRGSHVILMNEQQTGIVVSMHSGRKIKLGLVRMIVG